MSTNQKYENVDLTTRANIHFDGKCVSHDFVASDGSHKSAGVILPARLTFKTSQREIMECVAGSCRVLIKGEPEWRVCAGGELFSIPADSGFEIEVLDEPFHYICHYG